MAAPELSKTKAKAAFAIFMAYPLVYFAAG
jgi:hypothetical protein